VVRPAVPEGCALIRTSYMASHTDDDLDYVVEVLEGLGHKFGILGAESRQGELAALAQTHFGVAADATVTA
jgi:8-amino-7-oxononanoate synthase